MKTAATRRFASDPTIVLYNERSPLCRTWCVTACIHTVFILDTVCAFQVNQQRPGEFQDHTPEPDPDVVNIDCEG